MDLDMLAGMKVDELKAYLKLRGLRVNGRKEELVARAFVAAENNVAVVMTAEQAQQEIAKEYKSKLEVGNETLPDPFEIEHGWIEEDTGIKVWPQTLYPDIYNFLAFHPSELRSTDLSDYKTCKAYSYYREGWLSPLMYNSVEDSSSFCILRGTCQPSQRVNLNHKLWVCIEKNSGKVMCAHCSCMAGLSETCNHVAAALFRVEAAVRIGLANPSCTSKPCEWLPNNKTVQPVKVKDMKLRRADFGRKDSKEKELNCSPKKSFNPVVNISRPLNINDIITALKPVCKKKDSLVFCTQWEDEPVASTTQEDPGSSSTGNDLLTLGDLLIKCQNANEFVDTVKNYFASKVTDVEVATRGQADNKFWFAMRKHVISASIAHDVKTRLATILKSKTGKVNLSGILSKVAGESKLNPFIPALQYGREMENEAVACFAEMFESQHQNGNVKECGIFLCEDMPFVGGSPDRILSCDCCGPACLEVKCPLKARDTSPLDSKLDLPFLRHDANGEVKLNRNHKYFTQCQVQMAASGNFLCYFYVWSRHGNLIEQVKFDSVWWEDAKNAFADFYTKYYVPTLFKNEH